MFVQLLPTNTYFCPDKKDVESTENTEACSTLVTFDQVQYFSKKIAV